MDLYMSLLHQLWLKFAIGGITLGLVIGIFTPMFIGGDNPIISVGDRITLASNPKIDEINIPLATSNAIESGWVDPILCAAGRGRYFTKPDSSNLIILYNNQENVMGIYISSDVEMPEPWKKIDSLKGGGGLELISKEHWGLYVFVNNSLKACERPDNKEMGFSFLGPSALRTEYESTPTPTPKLNPAETISKISESLLSDSGTFAVINPADQTNIGTGITSSQVAELLSSITDAQEGTSKWIDNISNRGLTGNTGSITAILTSAKSDNLQVSLWVNDDNQVNLIEITGTITHDGSEITKLSISPE